MAYIYAQIEFESIISDLDRFLMWISDDSRCYFAVSESVTQPEWSYYAGNASHALESGNLLTAYDDEADAETNYLSTSKDANGLVFAMLPNFEKAKLVRVFFDEDYPLVLYEFNPEGFWYVDDTPANGRDTIPVSSNWAYDHENMGGTAGERYHLTLSEHTELTSWIDDVTLSDGGSVTLPSGAKIKTDKIEAYDSAGLFLVEDGGSGIFIEDNTGYIGIGTDSPNKELEISASTPTIRLTDSDDDDYGEIYFGDDSLVLESIQNGAYNVAKITIKATGEGSNDGFMQFQTASNNVYNIGMVIDENGNVGIGTDPDNLLHLYSSGISELKLERGGNIGDNVPAGDIYFSSSLTGNDLARIRGRASGEDEDAGQLTFDVSTGGSLFEAMRIDENGNVGIGTDSPGTKLDVRPADSTGFVRIADTGGHPYLSISASGGSEKIRLYGNGDSYFTNNLGIGTDSPNKELEISASTPTIRLTDSDDDDYGEIYFVDDNLVLESIQNGAYNVAKITLKATGEGSNDGFMQFQTAFNNVYNTGMVMDDSGNVGIGTDSPNAELEVNGDIIIADNGYIGSASDTDAIQIEADGDVVLTQDLTVDGSVILDSDSTKLRLGADQDFDIYHDGSNGYVDNNTGSLILSGNSTWIKTAGGSTALLVDGFLNTTLYGTLTLANESIVIPDDAYIGSDSSSQAIQIDSSGIVSMAQVYGHDINGETYVDLLINDSGELGYDSSAAWKKIRREPEPDCSFIYDIETWLYSPKKNPVVSRIGFMADQVESVLPDHMKSFVTPNRVDWDLEEKEFVYGPGTVNNKELIPAMIWALKNQKAELSSLAERIEKLEKQFN